LQARLERQIDAMRRQAKRELAGGDLQEAQEKVLASLQRNWAGYTVFVDHVEIPMDNNSERYLRNPVLGRKNYNGSGALAPKVGEKPLSRSTRWKLAVNEEVRPDL